MLDSDPASMGRGFGDEECGDEMLMPDNVRFGRAGGGIPARREEDMVVVVVYMCTYLGI